MPLIKNDKLYPEGRIGLWKIEESEIFFLEQMHLSPEEDRQIGSMKGHRRLEWLASRWLLHCMSGRKFRAACIKDEFGKPHLQDSAFEISLSHSRSIAAAIAAPQLVGIDIQKFVLKIERIAHKFMRPEETNSLRDETKLDHLHVYWGAKEALYKAYGRRALDFKEHLYIEPFEYQAKGGQIQGHIRKNAHASDYSLWYEKMGEYILVYGVQE